MKTVRGPNQAHAEMQSALEQIAELARELCRPDYSQVDNAIGRYLLETIRPVMQERAAEQYPAKLLSLRLLLSRLFGARRDQAQEQAPPITQTESYHARPPAFDCVLIESAGDAPDPRYEIEVIGRQAAAH